MAAVQTTITFSKTTTMPKGKKRTLTMRNGDEIDLASATSVAATPEIVEAMLLRILELENQLSDIQEPAAKRTKTSSVPATSTASSCGNSKADEKKRKIQLKKIFDRLKKECKNPSLKFQGTSKQIKIDEVYERAGFEALFGNHGTLIQPTPTNKPKSTVTIIQFNTSQVKEFFGSELKDLKGTTWSRGGGPSFAKSVKLGQCDVNINYLEVNYSQNGLKCSLKFDVEQADGHNECYRKYLSW